MSQPTVVHRNKWQENFPNVILNSVLGTASKHVQYLAAKTGNLDAAVSMVMDLINPETITRITNIIADKRPLLIPVHAEEAVSINRIPLAYAMILANICNLPVELNIVQAAKVNRTGSKGFTRLAFPPPFKGIPSQSARYAIILDDTLTQGGTLASLRGYIAQFGIETLVATTLTGKNYSSILAITEDTLSILREQYHELETYWIDEFGYGFDCFTESEARYIINSKKDVDSLRNRIIAERQTGFIS